jgi:hypothetical protein
MRRFAEDTSAPISRSRGEIDQLLRSWGAQGIQWTDDFEHDAVDSGLVDAETLFLPFLEDKNEKTIAEIALPRLGVLLEGSANRLLEAPKAH